MMSSNVVLGVIMTLIFDLRFKFRTVKTSSDVTENRYYFQYIFFFISEKTYDCRFLMTTEQFLVHSLHTGSKITPGKPH